MSATETITKARVAVERGEGLGGTGFWKLVAEIKADPSMDTYIDDVATVDQLAFRNWALLTLPLFVGTSLMVLGTLIGVALVGGAYATSGFWSGVWLLVGTATLLVTTHGLAHLLVGRALGISFTGWFIGTISRPQPGVKTDYRTYLRADPASRAWMHASGAIVTKLVPFLMIGAGLAADAPTWSILVLLAVGIVVVVTDVLWSTTASDWKKFKREMAFAQSS